MNKENIKNTMVNLGGPDWSILADVIDDSDFVNILNEQEKTIFEQIKNNPQSMGGYRHIIVEIISKAIPWYIYKKGVKNIKQQTEEISKEITENKKTIDEIKEVAKYIGGATVLVGYSESFNDRADKHKMISRWQLSYYLISLLLFVFLVGVTFFISISDFDLIKTKFAEDLKLAHLATGVLILKTILLFFVYQISQFFRKNYNAEKHLEEVYRHRSDVLQSLHGVYNSITDNAERDKILTAGALFAYERGETGYITTKEGAGSSDIMDGLFNKFLNK